MWSQVESQVEAWRRRVLGGGRNLRCRRHVAFVGRGRSYETLQIELLQIASRQTSVVDFVDHVPTLGFQPLPFFFPVDSSEKKCHRGLSGSRAIKS